MRWNKSFGLLISAIATLSLMACSEQMPANEQQEEVTEVREESEVNRITSEQLQQLNETIQRLVATPTASSEASCQVVAFGSKPCGGPSAWLIYSREVTDEAQLLPLVDEYNRLTDRYNQQEGLISDCAVLAPIQPKLENGVCVADDGATQSTLERQ